MTNTPLQLRRSVLYMPASNARALEKGKSLPADVLVLDLEDSVAPSAKTAAREAACAAVTSGDYTNHELVIRVNGLHSHWYERDIDAVSKAAPDAIAIPKLNSAEELRTVVEDLLARRTPERTKIWAGIETAAGLTNLDAIAAVSSRLTVLMLGTNDLAGQLRCRTIPGRQPLLGAMSVFLMGARAHDVDAIDGVFNDFRDNAGFADECQQAYDFGFDGKALIHPSQIDITNRIWAPTEEEVADARALIETYEDNLAAGRGVAMFQDRMIESLHADVARRVIARHEAITAR